MSKLFETELPQTELTVLSFGAGQDSTAILYKIVYDPDFREKYVSGKVIVVFADTGNEHPATYEHLESIGRFCDEHDIEFFNLASNEWATGDWKGGLIGFYEAKNTIGSKAFPKTCSHRLKIDPIYKFLEFYVYVTYDLARAFTGRKRGFYQFVAKHGKIRVLIGIASGEERRAAKNKGSGKKWFDDCIDVVYPLLDEGMNRADCQDFIRAMGHQVPLPSNCIFCPFLSKQELLFMARSMPEQYKYFVHLEQMKIDNNQHVDLSRNLGVFGSTKLLPEILEEAEREYGHWTIDQLHEYKMSHGHCVNTKF